MCLRFNFVFTISYSASVITVKKWQETQNTNQFPHYFETTYFNICVFNDSVSKDGRDNTYGIGMGAVRASHYQYSINSFLIVPARNDPCGDDQIIGPYHA